MSTMFEGFPVEVSPAYEGERIRAEDLHVEFGGPNVARKFELVRVKPMGEVEDGKVEVDGPDISELKEGGSYPSGHSHLGCRSKARYRLGVCNRAPRLPLHKLRRGSYAPKPEVRYLDEGGQESFQEGINRLQVDRHSLD